jgi:hypothetical protein
MCEAVPRLLHAPSRPDASQRQATPKVPMRWVAYAEESDLDHAHGDPDTVRVNPSVRPSRRQGGGTGTRVLLSYYLHYWSHSFHSISIKLTLHETCHFCGLVTRQEFLAHKAVRFQQLLGQFVRVSTLFSSWTVISLVDVSYFYHSVTQMFIKLITKSQTWNLFTATSITYLETTH